jgi:hypothetical protein
MSISRRKFIALSGAAAGVSAVDLTAFAQSMFAQNEDQPSFPRLGIIAIGNDQTYPPANWPTFAKFHVIIINGSFEIWGDARAYTREDVVRGIKAASSIDTKVFQYVGYNVISPTGAGFDINDPNSFFAAANRNKWWLYVNGTSGATVQSGAQTYIKIRQPGFIRTRLPRLIRKAYTIQATSFTRATRHLLSTGFFLTMFSLLRVWMAIGIVMALQIPMQIRWYKRLFAAESGTLPMRCRSLRPIY